MVTPLEPDILECVTKWALGSITTSNDSGGDGIPVVLFQILKDEAVKVLDSISQQIWKTQKWPQDWKRSDFIPIPKKGNAKECSNYVNSELPDVQAGFRKGRGPEIKLPTSTGSLKKQESSRKICFIDYAKAFDCVDLNKL